jgi:hypothetical protein
MYANFASEVGDAICIIVAGPFIPYPSTYLGKCVFFQFLYNRLRRRHPFSDTSACLLFTISICYRCMYANFTSEVGGALRIIMAGHTRVHTCDGGFFQFLCNRIRSYPHITYAWVYTIEDGVFFHYFIYRLRRRHHFQIHIQLPFFYDSLANLLSLFLHLSAYMPEHILVLG